MIFLTSSAERGVILQILADALQGGQLREEAFEYATADEEFEQDEELDPEERIELPEIELDPVAEISAHMPMQLTPPGRELLFVGTAVERWLSNAPGGPLRLGMARAGDPLATLLYCWSGTVVHALAGEPRTLHDLSQVVDTMEYETLEEHVEALRRNRLVEGLGEGPETRYAATRWLREGVAPLLAAARRELRSPMIEDTAPIDALDVGAIFALVLPLVESPGELGGACRLGVELDDGGIAGAVAHAEPGTAISAGLGVEPQEADAWATGDTAAWLDAVILGDARGVRTGGERALSHAVLNGVHEALFGARRR